MATEVYSVIPGWATVTALREPDPLAYNLSNAVEILFDFVPDDPAAAERYLLPHVADQGQVLRVGAGANPPRRWAEQMGFTPASRHRCLRRELRRGVGTPVLFEFPEIVDAAVAAAFAEGGP
jgi:hypothetical protein